MTTYFWKNIFSGPWPEIEVSDPAQWVNMYLCIVCLIYEYIMVSSEKWEAQKFCNFTNFGCQFSKSWLPPCWYQWRIPDGQVFSAITDWESWPAGSGGYVFPVLPEAHMMWTCVWHYTSSSTLSRLSREGIKTWSKYSQSLIKCCLITHTHTLIALLPSRDGGVEVPWLIVHHHQLIMDWDGWWKGNISNGVI